jgi:ribosome-binding factor A
VSFEKRRRPRSPHTDEVYPENDAARFFFDLESTRSSHRDRSLCRQAQEALLLALAEATADPRLDGAWIASVDPAPGSARLIVSVVLSKTASTIDAKVALAALDEMKPWLRSEVARAIHRKRVPELAFRLVFEE